MREVMGAESLADDLMLGARGFVGDGEGWRGVACWLMGGLGGASGCASGSEVPHRNRGGAGSAGEREVR